MTRRYLKSAHIEAFGRFFNRNVGPFSPGLNVVYGPNEAGKTTINAFIGGVLFGWRNGRSFANTYKPSNAERSGMLVFAARDDEDDIVRLSRARNAEGLQPDPNPPVLEDIDESTFATIFALDSDELLGLENADDVTARLLTAGAGTGNSPAAALAEVNDRLAWCTTSRAEATDSIPNCRKRLEELGTQIVEAEAQAERLKAQNRELDELEPRYHEASQRLERLNARISAIVKHSEALDKLEEEHQRLTEERDDIADRIAEETAGTQSGAEQSIEALSAAQVQIVRDTLDGLEQRQLQMQSQISVAQTAYRDAAADCEAAQKAARAAGLDRATRLSRAAKAAKIRLVAAVVVAVVAVALFVVGALLSTPAAFIAGGIALVAAAAIVVAGIFADRTAAAQPDAAANRLEEKQFALDQAQARFDAATRDAADLQQETDRYLAENGFADAAGSARTAKALFEERVRATERHRHAEERMQSLVARRDMMEQHLADNAARCEEARRAVGSDAEDGVERQILLSDITRQRDDCQQQVAQMSRRRGELEQILDASGHAKRLDELKLQQAMYRTRVDETMFTYAELLVARHILEESISTWESKSQPEVYVQASRLFALATEGAWKRVFRDGKGNLQVADAFDMVYDPKLLSTGTCQQLYLSLRIALLMTAQDVGRSIPILADDILVNFDDSRRRGAVAALAELARTRQVVLFTCHSEVVALMQDECEQVNLVQL